MIDIILGILLIYALYQGLQKTLLYQISSMVALLIGLYAAVKFSDIVANYLLENKLVEQVYVYVFAFFLTAVGVYAAVHLLGKMIEKMMKVTNTNFINKIGGVFFSVLKMVLIIAYVFSQIVKVNKYVPIVSQEKLSDSILFTQLIEPVLQMFF